MLKLFGCQWSVEVSRRSKAGTTDKFLSSFLPVLRFLNYVCIVRVVAIRILQCSIKPCFLPKYLLTRRILFLLLGQGVSVAIRHCNNCVCKLSSKDRCFGGIVIAPLVLFSDARQRNLCLDHQVSLGGFATTVVPAECRSPGCALFTENRFTKPLQYVLY